MRTLWFGFVLLILLHLAGIAAAGAWLYASGRINEDRINQVIDLFTPTIAEAAVQAAEEAQAAEESLRLAQQAARLEAIADGPVSLSERLATRQMADDVSMHRLERLQTETDDLRNQISRLKGLLAREQSRLTEERAAFEQYKFSQRSTTEEADFQQAVAMFEAIQPKQVKSVIDQMAREGKNEEAIDILAAMQPRKAGAVLREFKDPGDIPQLTDLLRGLRDRGVDDPDLMAGNSQPGAAL
ncbi:MAG: hypothetical protein RIG82_01315 [Phycisphaeraceae bacterium]